MKELRCDGHGDESTYTQCVMIQGGLARSQRHTCKWGYDTHSHARLPMLTFSFMLVENLSVIKS